MNYPNGIKKNNISKNITFGNRGMTLEKEIDITNEYYRQVDLAHIYKKPTPITISKVNYSKSNAIITEAFFKAPSTTDYNGIYKGMYIDFEAKETKIKNYFPLKNIHSHQIKHIESIIRHNGIAFLIIRFTTQNETFLLLGKDLIEYINNVKKSSIPYTYFKEKGFIIKDNYTKRVDYLQIIDKIIGGI